MNSPIFQRSLDERRKQITRQLQRAMLYKQIEKAVAHLPTGIRDENNTTLHFSVIKTHFYVSLIPSYATLHSVLINLLCAYPLKYCLLQYKVSKYHTINMFYK